MPWVAPFAAYMVFLALGRYLPLEFEYPVRIAVVVAILGFVSRRVIDWRMVRPLESVAVGVAVFLIWIGPDVLVPGWRSHWLFTNSFLGSPTSTAPDHLKSSVWFIAVRFFGCAAVVPLMEELFWRGWLARWVIDQDFERVALGTYTTATLLITSALFASEHGVYWDVGLAAGLLYNLWMRWTKSVGDLVLAHSVTNACLSVYVLRTGKWEYWF